jgi:acetyltransferase
VGIPPLNSTLARRLIEKTKISGALKGFRQRPAVDLKQLESVLTAYSELVVEQGRIRECDINPLFATASGIIALDARIVLHPAEKPVAEIPRPAIRPYPLEYVRSLTLKDGTPIVLRPIRLEDEGAMVRFHSTLSEDSLYQRYFGLSSLSQRTDHSRLIRVCLNDFDCQMAVVAVKAGSEEILGVGRLGRARESKTAEFALLVSDAWQHRGLGGALLDQLMEIGRTEGVERLTAVVLQGNSAMANLCREKGFEVRGREMDSTVQFDRILKTKRGRSQATPP